MIVQKNINFGIVYLIVSLLLLPSMFIACEPPIPFEVANQTDEVLLIYIGASPRGEVVPGETVKMNYAAVSKIYPFIIKSKRGQVIYSENLTSRELMRMFIILKPNE